MKRLFQITCLTNVKYIGTLAHIQITDVELGPLMFLILVEIVFSHLWKEEYFLVKQATILYLSTKM